MICVPSAGARELIRKPLLSLLMNLLNKHSILFPLSFPFLYLSLFFLLNTHKKYKNYISRNACFSVCYSYVQVFFFFVVFSL